MANSSYFQALSIMEDACNTFIKNKDEEALRDATKQVCKLGGFGNKGRKQLFIYLAGRYNNQNITMILLESC